MIRFRCKGCGKGFGVPDADAGKKGRCPKCKRVVVVPNAQATSPYEKQSGSTEPQTVSNSLVRDLILLDVPQKDGIQEQQVSQRGIPDRGSEADEELEQGSATEEAEAGGKRGLPWIIDIFLYPASKPGLTNLAIMVTVPLALRIVQMMLGPFALVLALPSLILDILIGLYICWYFAECVRDSAAGSTRAPEAFATVEIGDMFSQSLALAACYLFFVAPAGLYFLYVHKIDIIFWLLVAYAVFFFPMGLLATVMFNSSAAFNPILWIASIFSTLVRYCGLVLLISGVVWAARALANIQMGRVGTLTLGVLFNCIFLYVVFVVAHLLGRFYWCNEEKLDWDV